MHIPMPLHNPTNRRGGRIDQNHRDLTPLAGRGRFGPFFLHVDLPMAVDMEQLQVVTRVLTASAAPDAMMDPEIEATLSPRLPRRAGVAGDARWGSRPMAEHRVMARVLRVTGRCGSPG